MSINSIGKGHPTNNNNSTNSQQQTPGTQKYSATAPSENKNTTVKTGKTVNKNINNTPIREKTNASYVYTPVQANKTKKKVPLSDLNTNTPISIKATQSLAPFTPKTNENSNNKIIGTPYRPRKEQLDPEFVQQKNSLQRQINLFNAIDKVNNIENFKATLEEIKNSGENNDPRMRRTAPINLLDQIPGMDPQIGKTEKKELLNLLLTAYPENMQAINDFFKERIDTDSVIVKPLYFTVEDENTPNINNIDNFIYLRVLGHSLDECTNPSDELNDLYLSLHQDSLQTSRTTKVLNYVAANLKEEFISSDKGDFLGIILNKLHIEDFDKRQLQYRKELYPELYTSLDNLFAKLDPQ